jgi:hypothetical protein
MERGGRGVARPRCHDDEHFFARVSAFVCASDGSSRTNKHVRQLLIAFAAIYPTMAVTDPDWTSPHSSAGLAMYVAHGTSGMSELAGIYLQLALLREHFSWSAPGSAARWLDDAAASFSAASRQSMPSAVDDATRRQQQIDVALITTTFEEFASCVLYCDNLPIVEAVLDESVLESRGDTHLTPLVNLVRIVRCELHFLGVTCHIRVPRRRRRSNIISFADGQCRRLLAEHRVVMPTPSVPELVSALDACSEILRSMSEDEQEIAL